MGKILLIEPHKVLRQAISLSLFPEHEVRVEEGSGVPETGLLKDFDLLIVDGAALRENDRLTPELVRAVQSCKIPTLWLEEDESSSLPKREKLVMVKKPIEREAFQSALAAFLSPQGSSRSPKRSLAAAIPKTDIPKGAVKKKRAEASQQETFQFIDLVEVVDAQPPPKQGRKSPRKPK